VVYLRLLRRPETALTTLGLGIYVTHLVLQYARAVRPSWDDLVWVLEGWFPAALALSTAGLVAEEVEGRTFEMLYPKLRSPQAWLVRHMQAAWLVQGVLALIGAGGLLPYYGTVGPMAMLLPGAICSGLALSGVALLAATLTRQTAVGYGVALIWWLFSLLTSGIPVGWLRLVSLTPTVMSPVPDVFWWCNRIGLLALGLALEGLVARRLQHAETFLQPAG